MVPGPVGPYPSRVGDDPEAQEEYDKLRRRVLWTLTYGLYVVGSRAGARRNAMTLNWATQVSFEPKLVGIGVEKPAVTHELIAEGKVFSLCTISREDRAIVRKFTKPVEHEPGADDAHYSLNGFAFHDGATGAPVLDQAPAFADCEVRRGRRPGRAHLLHRRGGRHRLPGRGGHRGPPHGGHPP